MVRNAMHGLCLNNDAELSSAIHYSKPMENLCELLIRFYVDVPTRLQRIKHIRLGNDIVYR